jgi:hypothetical protein
MSPFRHGENRPRHSGGQSGGGKRTQAQTTVLVQAAHSRLRPGHLPAIFIDASDGYQSAILEACGRHDPAPRHSHKGGPRRPQR